MNYAFGAVAAPDTEVVQVDETVWQRVGSPELGRCS